MSARAHVLLIGNDRTRTGALTPRLGGMPPVGAIGALLALPFSGLARAQTRVGKDVAAHPITPALCVNDEELEFDTLLGGQVISMMDDQHQRRGAHPRGKPVPLLTRHIAAPSSLHLYWGSRSSQPARVRAFIDLAIERLADSAAYVLGSRKLSTAEALDREKFLPRT